MLALAACPRPLLAVLAATAVTALFDPASHGIDVVGPIPAGLHGPRLPDINPEVLRELALPAFTLLIVGFSDDVLTARSFATARREDQSQVLDLGEFAHGTGQGTDAAGFSGCPGYPW